MLYKYKVLVDKYRYMDGTGSKWSESEIQKTAAVLIY